MYPLIPILILSLVTGIVGIKQNAKTKLAESSPFPCAECDYIVKGYHNNAGILNIRPGQVICLDAAVRYEKVVFSDLRGTKEAPIIIRNCGGKAIVSSPGGFAIKFEHSENFRLIGDGDDEVPYGIKVTTKSGFYVSMENFTSDFEVARLEIAGLSPNGIGEDAGFAGIGIKTSPYQACDLFTDSTRTAWIMRNVSVHNNYIHDTGGEGLYIGHGFYKGRVEEKCPAKTYSHSIHGLRVYDNRVENTGFDGIQIKNADNDCEIYNNIIRNYGTRNDPAQNEGLFIGEGVTGKVFNNLIDGGTGHGIQFQGMGNNEFYNNIIINAGHDGFNASGSVMATYIPDGYVKIFNNTIYNSKRFGFVYYCAEGGKKIVKNNLVVRAGEKLSPKGAPLDSSHNIFTQNTRYVQFRDTANGDVRLKPTSPAINRGADIRVYGAAITFDFARNARPRGKGYDVGAYEQ